jgi:hypothetical protein
MRPQALLIALLLTTCLALSACARPTPTPMPTATPAPTATPVPTATTVPTPTATPFPMASEPAPEEAFFAVGGLADLKGEHGVQGQAVVAGLQTLIIAGFSFDGKGPPAELRLVKGTDYENPAAVLMKLEQRAYSRETLHMILPTTAAPGSADSIALYCPETHEAYAVGRFR